MRSSSLKVVMLLVTAMYAIPDTCSAQRTPELLWEAGHAGDPAGLFWVEIVGAVVVGQDVFVADSRLPVVRQFTLAGEHVRELGRSGQGPGEYLRPMSISSHADMVVVQDLAQRRRVFFKTDGTHVRTSRAGQPPAHPLLWSRDLRFGWAIGQTPWVNRNGEEFPYQVVVWKDPAHVDTLVTFAANQLRFQVRGDPRLHSSGISAGPDGAVAVLGDSTVVAVNGVTSELEVFTVGDEGLTLDRTEDLPDEPRSMTPTGRASLEARFDEWSESDPRLESILIPDYVTAWAEAISTSEGDVWLLRGNPYLDDPPRGQRWLRWSNPGGLTEEVELPLGVEALWFGADYVIARSKGELDIETLKMFALRAHTGPSRS